jgi:hypothetical protein
MSFGQEMKDFIGGYKAGEDIKEGRDRHQAALDAHEKNRLFREDEVSGGGGLGGTAPEIPDAQGDGKVDNDTAQIAGRLKGDLMRLRPERYRRRRHRRIAGRRERWLRTLREIARR